MTQSSRKVADRQPLRMERSIFPPPGLPCPAWRQRVGDRPPERAAGAGADEIDPIGAVRVAIGVSAEGTGTAQPTHAMLARQQTSEARVGVGPQSRLELAEHLVSGHFNRPPSPRRPGESDPSCRAAAVGGVRKCGTGPRREGCRMRRPAAGRGESGRGRNGGSGGRRPYQYRPRSRPLPPGGSPGPTLGRAGTSPASTMNAARSTCDSRRQSELASRRASCSSVTGLRSSSKPTGPPRGRGACSSPSAAATLARWGSSKDVHKVFSLASGGGNGGLPSGR